MSDWVAGEGDAAQQAANRRAKWEREARSQLQGRSVAPKKRTAPSALSRAHGGEALNAAPHRASDAGMRDLGGGARAHTVAAGGAEAQWGEETALDPVRKKTNSLPAPRAFAPPLPLSSSVHSPYE